MPDAVRDFNRNIAGKSDQIYDYLPARSQYGDFQRIEGINVVINSIRTLLLTPLGFYPFDPNFGSLLYKKVFDPLDDTSREEIEFEVRDRIQEFDDRVTITQVDIASTSTDGKSYQVDVYIEKGDLKGRVSVHLPGASQQFALEDI